MAEFYSAALPPTLSFKNPNWVTPYKRHKTAKQILLDEQKRLNSMKLSTDVVNYFSVEAYPSVKPKKHYCDITGLVGPYKVPSNGLRFHNSEVYGVIKSMPQGVDQEYLGLRNASVKLK